MSKTTIVIVLVLIVLAGLVAAYFLMGSSYKIPGYTTTTTQPGETTTTVKNSENTVTIQNFSFNPGTLTVKAGTTVTWKNEDSAPHRIKGDSFSSNDLSNGDTYQYTFANKGTYNYICGIHTYMKGKVVVE